MQSIPQSRFSLLVGLMICWCVSGLPAFSQQGQASGFFPPEDFVPMNATVPNSRLNFNDDTQESCCAKDYTSAGQPIDTPRASAADALGSHNTVQTVTRSEFERANPRYLENTTPAFLVTCEGFAQLPEMAANAMPAAHAARGGVAATLPIESYSTNVSRRLGAEYATNPAMRSTSAFHIETIGGGGQISLQDVHDYSICMARGNNVAMVANTDNASILTYTGSDHIYLSGNNTNMLTRTGAGEDLIELYQARSHDDGSAQWTAYNIYKTAISGGSETDTLVIKGTPVGTKWCHIGGYRIYGEYFYVVEFALPPSVTEGPRRQRINIGESVEYVMIKGKRYRLGDFLVHGMPIDTVALAVPLDAPLPHVAIR